MSEWVGGCTCVYGLVGVRVCAVSCMCVCVLVGVRVFVCVV